jgi:hypothetical protein
MKFFLYLTLSLVIIHAVNDSAAGQSLRLRSRIAPACASGTPNLKYADIYADGNIAVQGSYGCRGAFIYDISNPDAPVLAAWYNPGGNQQFLEAIVVGNRGYFGSGNGGGVHIVDLSNPSSPQLLGIVNSSNGGGFNSIHEMVVWGNFLITNNNGFSNKAIRFINVSNPAAPVFVRDLIPTEPSWVHAMHIRGTRMYTSGWGSFSQRGRTEIYDIANIATQPPTLLGVIEDPSQNVTAGNNMHSSWTSEDGNYLYSARETNTGDGDLRVYNITNPAVPLLVKRITMTDLGLNAVTPHNPVVMGNYLYVSWYQAGVQVFDISNPADPRRVGQYDTFQPAFAPPEQELKRMVAAEPWDMVCGSEFRQNYLPTTYDGNWAVFPFAGTGRILAGDLADGLLILDATRVAGLTSNGLADFDGDGWTDRSELRGDGEWIIENSSSSTYSTYNWGVAGDKPVNGDFDGDGKSDAAVWRPSNGIWFVVQSTGGIRNYQWGIDGDVPVPGDYDADGRTDLAIWRPSTGTWHIARSTLGIRTQQWGVPGDKAFAADYDGDGKDDIAVWRPSNGNWYVVSSASSFIFQLGWGEAGDRPLVADFDGDARADFTVFRPSNNTWYIFNPFTSLYRTQVFGETGDVPVPGDYDGDGVTDFAVFRPSTRIWFRLNSSDGGFITGTLEPPPADAAYAPVPQFAQP